MSDLREKILGVMSVAFEINLADIPANAAIGAIEKWDSLKHMKLVILLEEEFDIRFPDDLIEHLTSLDLIEFNIKLLTDSEQL